MISRDVSSVADRLAFLGPNSSPPGVRVFELPPPEVQHLLLRDALGIS